MLTVLEEDYQLEYRESYRPWWAYHWGISILYGPEKSFWVIDVGISYCADNGHF